MTSTWETFTEFDLSEITDPTWHSILAKHEPFLKKMSEELRASYDKFDGHFDIYPPVPLVFNALKLVPFDSLKAVLFGQDPYHGPGQAMGLCFSVNRGIPVPPSLVNIYQELEQDSKVTFKAPKHGDLSSWAKQGVLMLNTALTVRQNKAGSHAAFKYTDEAGKTQYLRWNDFIDDVVNEINTRKKNVVWMLWGTPAKTAYGSKQTVARRAKVSIDPSRHLILEAQHPSPLSAYQNMTVDNAGVKRSGWFGCGHFSKCNEYLIANGETPIDWQLPE